MKKTISSIKPVPRMFFSKKVSHCKASIKAKEEVFSLLEDSPLFKPQNQLLPPKQTYGTAFSTWLTKQNMATKLNVAYLTINNVIKHKTNPQLVVNSFFILTLFVLLGTLVNAQNVKAQSTPKYSIFSAKPLTLGTIEDSITIADSRGEILDTIFNKYKCPFAGMGNVFVQEADKNNIPFWLVPAISFQESGCGKNTPTKDGHESYNAYGWGVWGEHLRTFDSWEQGVAVVSKYMSERFYSQGITDICDIMKTYTPPSDGSWCNGVSYYKNAIINYKSPLN